MALQLFRKHLPEGDDEPRTPRVPPVKEPDPDVPEPDQEDGIVFPIKNMVPGSKPA